MDFTLSADHEALVEETDALARREFAPTAARWDRNAEYPHENIETLRQEGYLGMTIPEDYGGPERSLLDVVLAIEQVSKYCGVTGRVVVDTNVGALGATMAYGTEDQREWIAERILEHGDKPAIAMTEPDAGSDLGSLSTTATRDGDEYVIDGHKHWITGGGVSRSYFVFARFREDGEDQGIGGVLVDADADGLTVADVEDAMGVRGTPEGEIVFDGCRVPESNVVVAPGPDSFKKLMRAYNAQRVCATAVAVGIAQGAHDLAVEFMEEREVFDGTVSDLQGPRWEMAEGETELEAARLLLYRAAANADELANNVQLPDRTETALVKSHGPTAAFEVANDALQMFGARGYSKHYPLERMLRDVRMFKIGGGTTEVQKNGIARAIFEDGDDELRARLADFE